jgi:N-acetyl-beta-hexosaminidase
VSSLPLVPVPASVVVDDAAPFLLTGSTTVAGDRDAVAALGAAFAARTGLTPATDAASAAIRLLIEHGGKKESYRLDAGAGGVDIVGADAAGLFYGIQTLAQLLTSTDEGWIVPALSIVDAPRFAYRGVMLDVARHFFPVDVVKGYIDRAASLKLNALHLHLSDDQGWRLELRSRPELTARASDTSVGGGSGGFYTRDDYREIVAHAASRHLIVVPEFDTPGHTHAVGLAYPELAADPVLSDTVVGDTETFGGDLPAAGTPYTGVAVGFSSLRIDSEATYDFLADVFGEVAGLTPGPYLHFGGDEALGTSPEDFAEFVGRVSEIIAGLDKIPIAWHEAGAAPLAEGTIGQFWGLRTPAAEAEADARAFVAAGSRLILSPADAIYLDHKYDDDTRIGATWADGPTSVESSYSWEPTAIVSGLTDADILGVEACLWTETVWTDADIDELAFPRIASAAEIAWSPQAAAERTWESFRTRVGALGPLWRASGIGFSASPEIPWID